MMRRDPAGDEVERGIGVRHFFGGVLPGFDAQTAFGRGSVCAFERSAMQRSHRWFRWFNEIPVLLLVAAVVLVVVKPF